MSFAGFGRSQLRFDMFDVARSAEEARRGEKLANLYHKGQDLAWDGRAVLAELLAKHGGVRVADDKRAALAEVFTMIMWGELAAWKISVQLADHLVALEPKMAATSQAHDEARHFYVMVDYLRELGHVPTAMDRTSRVVLDLVLETGDLAKKLLGMQLMVESLALTIFQAVRDLGVEPVLCDLLRYYEKDEARHVGLGTQVLPQMIKQMGKAEAAGLFAFQMQILGWSLAGLKAKERAFRTLGLDARRIVALGRAKQILAFQTMWDQLGITAVPRSRELVIRAINGVVNTVFDGGPPARTRLGRFVAGWRQDLDEGLPDTALHPDDAPRRVSIPRASS